MLRVSIEIHLRALEMCQSLGVEKQGRDFSPRVAKPREGKNKIPPESQKAHNIFSTNGLAGEVKIKFPLSGEAAKGETLFF